MEGIDELKNGIDETITSLETTVTALEVQQEYSRRLEDCIINILENIDKFGNAELKLISMPMKTLADNFPPRK